MKKCSYCGRDNTDEAVNCRECGTEFERPEEGDETHSQENTKTIHIFGTHENAALAAANLEAHGIKCWVDSDDCAGMYPNLTTAAGVRLKVRAEEVEAATALLEAQATPAEIEQIEKEAIASSPEKSSSLKRLAWGQIIIGIFIGILMMSLLVRGKNEPKNETRYHYTAAGKCDEAWVYRNGHLIQFSGDRNLDGKWDHWRYYQNGSAVRSEYDNNFDGKADEIWTYSEDGNDTLEKDTDFNGIPDEFCSYKYQIIQKEEMKPNGSKFVTKREFFHNGVLTEIWRGGDSNGNFSEVVRYDPFFNPISTNVPKAF